MPLSEIGNKIYKLYLGVELLKFYRFWKKFMSNQIIFIVTMCSLGVSFAKYEISKYYMFLKYENLVNAYIDCQDR